MPKKLMVRRGCIFSSPLSWPSTKKSDDTEEWMVAASHRCLRFGILLRVDTTRVLSVGGSLPPWGAAGERPRFSVPPPP